MRTNVQDTSLEAYHEIMPKLPESRERVFKCLLTAPKPLNDKEIAKTLQIPINEAVPRRHELVKQGLVVESGKRVCSITKKMCLTWTVKITQGELF